MDQYFPAGNATDSAYPEINRRLTSGEFREAQRIASDLGPRRLDVRRPHALEAADDGFLRRDRRLTMPVYEFVCRDCQKTFEIVRPISESSVNLTCTHCGSSKVERTWSAVYAVTSKKS